jgi:beta-mannanase
MLITIIGANLKKIIIILLISIILIAAGCVSAITSSQITKLKAPSQGVYLAAFPDFGGPEDAVSTKKIVAFKKLTGQTIVWAAFSDNWGKSKITFPASAVKAIHQAGITPYIRLMPRSTLEDSYSKPDKTYSLDNIINGKFDTQLRKWARAAKNSNIPLIIDFAPEMNGDWFPWSGKLNGAGTKNKYGNPNLADGPEKYRDAYRHIITIFRQEKVTKVTWVFHVDAYNTPGKSWNNYKAYYPGDSYIDWIGVSSYGAQTPSEDWQSFNEVMSDSYPQLSKISSKKPLAVLEFGVTESGTKKAKWINDALNSIKNKKYPRIKAISYWHENWENSDGTMSRLRLDSSKNSLSTYKNLIKSSFFIKKAQFT